MIGSSGDKIDHVVYKHGNPRLKLQALKQQQFQYSGIQVPQIYKIFDDGFMMEYISNENFVNYARFNSKYAIYLFNQIIKFIQHNLKKSITCTNNGFKLKVCDKLTDLYKQNPDKIYTKILYKLQNLKENIKTGDCHGDLTLGNILIRNNTLYYIDFLPIFFESPIQDIIKIRQDTRDLWSLYLMESDNRYFQEDSKKLIHTLRDMDKIICTEFKDIINTETYKILEIINYLRLIPYTKSQTILIYIQNIINKLSCTL